MVEQASFRLWCEYNIPVCNTLHAKTRGHDSKGKRKHHANISKLQKNHDQTILEAKAVDLRSLNMYVLYMEDPQQLEKRQG